MTFEEMLTQLKGQQYCTRLSWPDADYIVKQNPSDSCIDVPFITYVTIKGVYYPWLPTILDLFANDWAVVNI